MWTGLATPEPADVWRADPLSRLPHAAVPFCLAALRRIIAPMLPRPLTPRRCLVLDHANGAAGRDTRLKTALHSRAHQAHGRGGGSGEGAVAHRIEERPGRAQPEAPRCRKKRPSAGRRDDTRVRCLLGVEVDGHACERPSGGALEWEGGSAFCTSLSRGPVSRLRSRSHRVPTRFVDSHTPLCPSPVPDIAAACSTPLTFASSLALDHAAAAGKALSHTGSRSGREEHSQRHRGVARSAQALVGDDTRVRCLLGVEVDGHACERPSGGALEWEGGSAFCTSLSRGPVSRLRSRSHRVPTRFVDSHTPLCPSPVPDIAAACSTPLTFASSLALDHAAAAGKALSHAGSRSGREEHSQRHRGVARSAQALVGDDTRVRCLLGVEVDGHACERPSGGALEWEGGSAFCTSLSRGPVSRLRSRSHRVPTRFVDSHTPLCPSPVPDIAAACSTPLTFASSLALDHAAAAGKALSHAGSRSGREEHSQRHRGVARSAQALVGDDTRVRCLLGVEVDGHACERPSGGALEWEGGSAFCTSLSRGPVSRLRSRSHRVPTRFVDSHTPLCPSPVPVIAAACSTPLTFASSLALDHAAAAGKALSHAGSRSGREEHSQRHRGVARSAQALVGDDTRVRCLLGVEVDGHACERPSGGALEWEGGSAFCTSLSRGPVSRLRSRSHRVPTRFVDSHTPLCPSPVPDIAAACSTPLTFASSLALDHAAAAGKALSHTGSRSGREEHSQRHRGVARSAQALVGDDTRVRCLLGVEVDGHACERPSGGALEWEGGSAFCTSLSRGPVSRLRSRSHRVPTRFVDSHTPLCPSPVPDIAAACSTPLTFASSLALDHAAAAGKALSHTGSRSGREEHSQRHRGVARSAQALVGDDTRVRCLLGVEVDGHACERPSGGALEWEGGSAFCTSLSRGPVSRLRSRSHRVPTRFVDSHTPLCPSPVPVIAAACSTPLTFASSLALDHAAAAGKALSHAGSRSGREEHSQRHRGVARSAQALVGDDTGSVACLGLRLTGMRASDLPGAPWNGKEDPHSAQACHVDRSRDSGAGRTECRPVSSTPTHRCAPPLSLSSPQHVPRR
ncbi:MAG: hypothetical protein WDW38_001340 [Sanguina aurantia]